MEHNPHIAHAMRVAVGRGIDNLPSEGGGISNLQSYGAGLNKNKRLQFTVKSEAVERPKDVARDIIRDLSKRVIEL